MAGCIRHTKFTDDSGRLCRARKQHRDYQSAREQGLDLFSLLNNLSYTPAAFHRLKNSIRFNHVTTAAGKNCPQLRTKLPRSVARPITDHDVGIQQPVAPLPPSDHFHSRPSLRIYQAEWMVSVMKSLQSSVLGSIPGAKS
jgi:hypothetical protein